MINSKWRILLCVIALILGIFSSSFWIPGLQKYNSQNLTNQEILPNIETKDKTQFSSKIKLEPIIKVPPRVVSSSSIPEVQKTESSSSISSLSSLSSNSSSTSSDSISSQISSSSNQNIVIVN
jgi:hypothetical protein